MNVFFAILKNTENIITATGNIKPYIFKAVFTGIVAMPMELHSHCFNHFTLDDMSSTVFPERYGFTFEEVERLRNNVKSNEDINEIKAWYNGYRSGEKTVYNPYSIVQFLEGKNSNLIGFFRDLMTT